MADIIGSLILTTAVFKVEDAIDYEKLGIEPKNGEKEIEEELVPFSFKLEHLVAYNQANDKSRTIIRLLNGENFSIDENFDEFDELISAIEIEKEWIAPTRWERFKWWVEDKFKKNKK